MSPNRIEKIISKARYAVKKGTVCEQNRLLLNSCYISKNMDAWCISLVLCLFTSWVAE